VNSLMHGGLFSHLQGVTTVGLPAGPWVGVPPGPASWIKEPVLSVPLLPALSCVGHDGQAMAAAAGESEAKTGDHADVLAG
jgi:hypothetical protein